MAPPSAVRSRWRASWLPALTGDLTLYWLEEYSGGVLLPFGTPTSGAETYGGGRYLLDTAKGADLGSEGSSVVLDFNDAYHPSCTYDRAGRAP